MTAEMMASSVLSIYNWWECSFMYYERIKNTKNSDERTMHTRKDPIKLRWIKHDNDYENENKTFVIKFKAFGKFWDKFWSKEDIILESFQWPWKFNFLSESSHKMDWISYSRFYKIFLLLPDELYFVPFVKFMWKSQKFQNARKCFELWNLILGSAKD